MLQLTILHATTETWRSQINQYIFFKKLISVKLKKKKKELTMSLKNRPLDFQASGGAYRPFLKNYLLIYIYFGLCRVFVAVRGLSLVAANSHISYSWCHPAYTAARENHTKALFPQTTILQGLQFSFRIKRKVPSHTLYFPWINVTPLSNIFCTGSPR